MARRVYPLNTSCNAQTLWQKYQRFYRAFHRTRRSVFGQGCKTPSEFPHGEFARASVSSETRRDEKPRELGRVRGEKRWQIAGFNFLALVVQISRKPSSNEFRSIRRVSTYSSKLFVSCLRFTVHRYRLPSSFRIRCARLLFYFADDSVFLSTRESTSIYNRLSFFIRHTFASRDELYENCQFWGFLTLIPVDTFFDFVPLTVEWDFVLIIKV